MPRVSAFRGSFTPNARPYVVVAPDVYVSVQGETSVVACGECQRKIDVNAYVTSVSTEGSVDSPPGSATIGLSIPDNDKNYFYSDGEFIIIPMMEIEIFAKGYYTIGGVPQYYRIFWGVVSSVSHGWSNGVTTITLSCKDILRWWELTNVNINPAFLDSDRSLNNWKMYANVFAGANPYTIIIALAKESMGDMSLTTGSFTSGPGIPEKGPETPSIGSYAKDVMAYWQLKFGNIWNSLVCYGTSGQAYTFTGDPSTVSPIKVSAQIFDQEAKNLNLNQATSQFRIQPQEVAAFKVSLDRAAETNFFQSEIQSKLSIAMTARDQAGFEFYCDTTGDIIFKPPFYNLNVLPNKPVSWIQDFEVMDDQVTDSEAEVYTHITSSGNAFGGVFDPGLNDDITTPRAGVIDYHLLRRYGWRRLDYQCEWAGNPRKLFYHLLDYLDRVNSKRKNGTVTIPMRPELRMGFPIWFPKYDSFFYVQGISHNFSPGGQATTTLTLTAKRSKFIAPKNIGSVTRSGSANVQVGTDPRTKQPVMQTQDTFSVTFPSGVGETTNLSGGTSDESGGPAIIRDPKTGKLLGYPNAVMVYRKTLSDQVLAVVQQKVGSTTANKPTKQAQNPLAAANLQSDILKMLANNQRAQLLDRLRTHRYEAGFSSTGLYDYAHDENGFFKQFSVIPSDSITWGNGTDGGPDSFVTGAVAVGDSKARASLVQADVDSANRDLQPLIQKANDAKKVYDEAQKAFLKNPKDAGLKTIADTKKSELQTAQKAVDDQRKVVASVIANSGANLKKLPSLNVMVRPVSDEFGFELIGHYRYGRGAFIDRGKVSLQDPATNATINQINVQFAPTGGLLTTSPPVSLGPESKSFEKAFNEMQPEDYLTGASFKGANYPNGVVDPNTVNYTSQSTYTNSINSTVTKTNSANSTGTTTSSTAVYAEADATSRAKLLSDLSPTMANGLDSQQGNACACALGNSNWLSVLPQSFISQVLAPVQQTKQVPVFDENGVATGDTVQSDILVAAGVSQAVSDPSGFFNVLSQYLVERFSQEYQQNLQREQFATNGGRSPIDFASEDAAGGLGNPGSSLLGNPYQSLFNRAAGGDPDALAALHADATVDTAAAIQGLDQFNKQMDAINAQANQTFSLEGAALSDAARQQLQSTAGGLAASGATGGLPSIPGTVNVGPRQQFQPPAAGPSLSSVLNPKGLPPQGSSSQDSRLGQG